VIRFYQGFYGKMHKSWCSFDQPIKFTYHSRGKPRTAVYCYIVRSIKLSAFSIAGGQPTEQLAWSHGKHNRRDGKPTRILSIYQRKEAHGASVLRAKHCSWICIVHVARVEWRSLSLYGHKLNRAILWPPLTGFDVQRQRWWKRTRKCVHWLVCFSCQRREMEVSVLLQV